MVHSLRARVTAWTLMVVGFLLFCAADIYAASQERDGRSVTASSFMRKAVRRCPLVLVAGVAWVIWHFGVQAWFPGLPL